MPKAYSYARFSSKKQDEGDSLRRQTTLAREYAEREGLELDDTLTLYDKGVSAYRGKNKRRGKLGEFLALVKAGDVPRDAFLLVEDLDRVSREQQFNSTETLFGLLSEGITVVVLVPERVLSRETINKNPMLMFEITAWFMKANSTSATTASRVRQRWNVKREQVKEDPQAIRYDSKQKRHLPAYTSRCPGWLQYDDAKQRFVLIPERAKIVRRIFREALNGSGVHGIAERLNADGVQPFWTSKRKSPFWRRAYVKTILDNPAAFGTLVTKTRDDTDGSRKLEDTIENYYPPVIDKETWNRIPHKRPQKGRKGSGRKADSALQNIFAMGLLRCGRCGDAVILLNKGSAGAARRYLVCERAREGGECKYRAIRYEPVEEAFLLNAPWLLHTAPAGGEQGQRIERMLLSAEGTLSDLCDSRENIIRAIERGRALSLTQRLDQIEKAIDAETLIKEHLEQQREAAHPKIIAKKIAELEEVLTTSPLDRRAANALMRQLFERITLDYGSGSFLFTWQHGGQSDLIVTFPEDFNA